MKAEMSDLVRLSDQFMEILAAVSTGDLDFEHTQHTFADLQVMAAEAQCARDTSILGEKFGDEFSEGPV